MRESQLLPVFKRHLKTHFFQSAYPAPYDTYDTHSPTHPGSSIDFGTI